MCPYGVPHIAHTARKTGSEKEMEKVEEKRRQRKEMKGREGKMYRRCGSENGRLCGGKVREGAKASGETELNQHMHRNV